MIFPKSTDEHIKVTINVKLLKTLCESMELNNISLYVFNDINKPVVVTSENGYTKGSKKIGVVMPLRITGQTYQEVLDSREEFLKE